MTALLCLVLAADPLVLTAERDVWMLGEDKEAIIFAAAGPLRLGSTVGAIARRADGAISVAIARVRRPQFAIVSAITPDDRVAFLVLRFTGRAEAIVKTSPRRPVNVRVGDAVFGPLTSDAQGTAVVPIVVPAGVYDAYFGQTRVDLGLERHSTLQVTSAFTEVSTDIAQALPFYVKLIDAAGAPLSDATLAVQTDAGEAGAPAAIGGGVYRGVWTLPAGSTGPARLTVTHVDGTPATIEVMRRPGKIETLTQRCPAAVNADAPSTQILVTSFDAAGTPTTGQIEASASFGTLTLAAKDAEHTVTLTLPERFEGRRTADVTLHAGPATVHCEIILRGGVASRLSLRADRFQLALTAFDPHDNPTALPAPPELHATLGTIDGLTFTPPALELEDSVTVDARSGALTASTQIFVARASRQWFVAPSIGVGGNFSNFLSPSLQISGGYQLHLGAHMLYAAAAFDYMLRRDSGLSVGSAIAGGGGEDLFGLSVRVGFRPRLSRRFYGDVAIGGGSVIIASSSTVAPGSVISERGAAAAIDVIAGAQYLLARGGPFLALRLRWQADPHMQTVRGAFVGLFLDVGYRVEIF